MLRAGAMANNKKNKPSALASAASRKLAGIGGPRMTPENMAHQLFHAEERGEVSRVTLEDGTWAWSVQGPNGPQMLKPTPEMLAALARIEAGDHNH